MMRSGEQTRRPARGTAGCGDPFARARDCSARIDALPSAALDRGAGDDAVERRSSDDEREAASRRHAEKRLRARGRNARDGDRAPR